MPKRSIREPGHLSQRGYAAHRGCHQKEVYEALKAGRIHLEKDGAIDPVRADREWAASVNPASAKRPGMKPGETTLNKKGGAPTSFTDARTRSETAKAALAELRLKQQQGELLSSRFANEAAFAFARLVRSRIEVWPSRISALMAAEIKVDPHLMEVTLERHIRDLLRSMADEIDSDDFAAKLMRGKGQVQ